MLDKIIRFLDRVFFALDMWGLEGYDGRRTTLLRALRIAGFFR